MLPSAPPLTQDLAQQWVARATPRFYARALVALWAVAFLVAVFTDNQVCTPSDPSVCGPSQAFAFWFVICCASPVLLLWMPLLGCVAAVAFALADVAMDDVTGAKVAFSLFALLCVGFALRLTRDTAAQRALVSPRAAPVVLPQGVAYAGRASWFPLAAAVLALVAGIASFVVYRHEDHAERGHLARGHVVDARVVAVDGEDWKITLEVPDELRTRRVTVDVIEVDPYPVGSTTPVVLDPSDPGWVRLVAEPADPTPWESGAYGGVLLALVLTGRGEHLRRRTQQLFAGATSGFAVRVLPDGGKALVLPTDGPADPVARMAVGWQGPGPDEDDPDAWGAEEVEAFGRFWRGEGVEGEEDDVLDEPVQPDAAVLVGDLRDGAVALLLLEDGTLVPRGALRPVTPAPKALERLKGLVPKRFRGTDEPSDEDDSDDLGRPVVPDRSVALPDLPLVAGPPSSVRLRGLLMLAAALVGGPLAIAFVADDWWNRGVTAAIGMQLLHGALYRLVQRVELSREALDVVGPGRRHHIPWDRLHGVRQFDDVLSVAWEPDMVAEVGPFAASGGQDPAARAQHLGAVMMRLRERARAAGTPGRDVVDSPGASWFAIPAYVLLLGATAWLLGWPG